MAKLHLYSNAGYVEGFAATCELQQVGELDMQDLVV